MFPPLNQNTNPPTAAIVPPGAKPPTAPAASGTLPGDEPRKIRTLAVKGDPADVGGNAGAEAPGRAASRSYAARCARPGTVTGG